MTVSAIMPAYNAAGYIGPAIESVLAQTFSDWELIVVDDGSTDRTLEVVSQYTDPRIRVCCLPQNRGRGAARNAALLCATGRYIAPCDSDDISLPERFAREAEFLDRHAEVGVVSGQIKYFWKDEPPAVRMLYPEDPASVQRRFDRGKMAVAHGASMIRRECFDRYGPYRNDCVRAEDFELFLRFRKGYAFCTLPEFLLLYRHEVRGVGWRKWVETMWYHRYAIYRATAADGMDESEILTFPEFADRWQGKLGVYTLDLLGLARYTMLSYFRPRRALR